MPWLPWGERMGVAYTGVHPGGAGSASVGSGGGDAVAGYDRSDFDYATSTAMPATAAQHLLSAEMRHPARPAGCETCDRLLEEV